MISIVVCSVSERQFLDFEQNVKATIGVEFEIIRVDNSSNKYSICAAYNLGGSKAKFPIICFSHEDIILKTPDWGTKVFEIFEQKPNLGALGIAGSTYKAYAPSGWGIIPELRHVNLIQHYKSLPFDTQHDCQNPGNERLSRVVAVDGVWICTTKQIFSEYKFDSQTFQEFHCYDLDFCMSIAHRYEVAVTFDILLEHLSEGKNDRPWITNTMKFHRKWRKNLPVNLSTIDNKIIRQQEYAAVYYFMIKMFENRFNIFQILNMLSYNVGNKSLTKGQLLLLTRMAIKNSGRRILTGMGIYKG